MEQSSRGRHQALAGQCRRQAAGNRGSRAGLPATFPMLATFPVPFCIERHSPEGGTEIEPVAEVLCLNEHIGVEKIACHPITPASRPNLLNVSVLETPSIRNASR